MAAEKILIATDEYPPYRGGIGRYCEEVGRAAVKMGYEVEVSAPAYGLVRGGQAVDGMNIYRHRGGVPSLASLPRLVLRLHQDMRRNTDSILHIASWGSFLAGRILGVTEKRKCVVTFYGSELLTLPHSRLYRAMGIAEYVKKFSRIVAISGYTKSLIIKSYGLSSSAITETPLGVSEFWFQPPERGGELRKKLEIPSEYRLLSTVARIDIRKGQDLAIRALSEMPKEYARSIAYVIAGNVVDKAYFKQLKALADGCEAKIFFASGLTDQEIRTLYSISDLSLMTGSPHPSRVEGFGLVVLEANAQGVPVVVTPGGAIPEVIRHGKTGGIAASASSADVASAIVEALRNIDSGAITKDACRQFAKEYNWERTAMQTYKGLE